MLITISDKNTKVTIEKKTNNFSDVVKLFKSALAALDFDKNEISNLFYVNNEELDSPPWNNEDIPIEECSCNCSYDDIPF